MGNKEQLGKIPSNIVDPIMQRVVHTLGVSPTDMRNLNTLEAAETYTAEQQSAYQAFFEQLYQAAGGTKRIYWGMTRSDHDIDPEEVIGLLHEDDKSHAVAVLAFRETFADANRELSKCRPLNVGVSEKAVVQRVLEPVIMDIGDEIVDLGEDPEAPGARRLIRLSPLSVEEPWASQKGNASRVNRPPVGDRT